MFAKGSCIHIYKFVWLFLLFTSVFVYYNLLVFDDRRKQLDVRRLRLFLVSFNGGKAVS